MRLIALDVGDSRIGVAVSDATGLIAKPLAIIRRGDGGPAARIANLIREHEATTVVVGHPRNMDGTIGPQARKCETFAERLREALKVDPAVPEIQIVLWDERLSTEEAREMHRQAGGKKRKPGRPEPIDHYAAAVILQEYLDHIRDQRLRTK